MIEARAIVGTREVLERILQTLESLLQTLKGVEHQLKILNLDEEVAELKVIDVDQKDVVRRGEYKTLLNVQERGFVIAIAATTNNKNALLEVTIDGMKMMGTVRDLYEIGLIGFNPTTFYLTRYDEVDNIYCAWYTPIPMRKYFGRIRFTVYAPMDSDVIYSYSIYRIVLK